MSSWHAWQGNKIGVMSSWQYYCQIWETCPFCLYNYHQVVGCLVSNRGKSVFYSHNVNILMQHETMKCELFKLVLWFNFWRLLYVLSLMGSFSGQFETCSKCQKLKNWIKVLIWKVWISLVHVAWLYQNARCKKHKSQNILLILQLTGTLLYV